MPSTAQKIFAQLNTTERTLDELNEYGKYPSGNKVTEKPEILFARLDIKEVLEKVEEQKAAQAKEAQKPAEPVIDIEAKPEITFEDFEKLQFQVGEIIACEEVKKSKSFYAHR